MAKGATASPAANTPTPAAQPQKGAKKKDKSTAVQGKLPPLPHRDLFHRISFTYQASAYLAQLAKTSTHGVPLIHPALKLSHDDYKDIQTPEAKGVHPEQGVAGPSRLGPGESADLPLDIGWRSIAQDGGDVQGIRNRNRKGKARSEVSSSSSLAATVIDKYDISNDDQGVSARVSAASDRRKEHGLAKLARRGMKDTKWMIAHNLVKLDPTLKRSICKSCSSVLIPGLTAKVRIRPNSIHMHKSHLTCFSCDSVRSIPCPPTSTSTFTPIISTTTQTEKPQAEKSRSIYGPLRSARMNKIARRSNVPFHLREHNFQHNVNPDSSVHNENDNNDDNTETSARLNVGFGSNIDTGRPTEALEMDPEEAAMNAEAENNLHVTSLNNTPTNASATPTLAPPTKADSEHKTMGSQTAKSHKDRKRRGTHSLWRGEEVVSGWAIPHAFES